MEVFRNCTRASFLNLVPTHIAVDTETISIKDKTCIGIGIQWSDTESLYISVWPDESNLLIPVLNLIANSHITKIYFNSNFDFGILEFLHQTDSTPLPDYTNFQDAYYAAQIQGLSDHSLEGLSSSLIRYNNSYSIQGLLEQARVDEGRSQVTMLDVDPELVAEKCLNDVYATWHVWNKLNTMWPNLQNKECYEIDIKLIPVLKSMERKGLLLDQELIDKLYIEYKQQSMGLLNICANEGFNPGSNQQVGYILASRGNILPFTRSKRQLQVDEDTLGECEDPLAQVILQYRKAVKLLSTYIDPWRGEERAYTRFRIDLSTGRLASYDRNLQNIPPTMRVVFRPDSSIFQWLDYSQIEMRLFAFMSHDTVMMEAYNNNQDIHALTQLALWPGSDTKDEAKRLVAKTFNFAMVYEANIYTLAKQTNLPTNLLYQFRNRWLTLYKQGWQYMEDRMQDDSTYAVSDFGRRMSLPSIEFTPQTHIDKAKINYPIQGTAADIIKRAMLKVGGDLRLQVHDELVFDGEVSLGEELSRIHPEIFTPYNTYTGEKWK